MDTNPFWEHIQRLVEQGSVEYDKETHTLSPVPGQGDELRRCLIHYSRVIADPAVVEYISAMAGKQVVEMEADGGYWSYLLSIKGATCEAFDTRRRWLFRNDWYPVGRIHPQFNALGGLYYATLLIVHTDPPKFERVARALSQSSGPRAILVLPKTFTPPQRRAGALENWNETSRFDGGVCLASNPVVVRTYDRKRVETWNQPTRPLSIRRTESWPTILPK